MIHCKGLIFDLFHTLTGDLTEVGDLPPTYALLGVDRQAWNKALFEDTRPRLIGEVRDPEEIVRLVAHAIDARIPDERISAAARARTARFRRILREIPADNVETLEHLRADGFTLALVSNADASEVAGWADSPLARYFDVEMISCHVGMAKPDVRIYQQCLERMSLGAADCLFVGDGGSGELEGAQAAGIRTVFVSGIVARLWPERVAARRAVADHEITSIPEILHLVAGPGGRR